MTCFVLSVVAFMLLHTLWRKVLPKESEEATVSLTESVYDLLVHERWGLAARLAKFSLTNEMKKSAKDIDIRIRVINLAIALKKCDAQKEVEKLLAEYDWSATPRDFKLANAVLLDDFPEAIKMMRAIGKEGDVIKQAAYHDWPLFSDFKNRDDFRAAYKEIYSYDFELMSTEEPSAATISEILEQQDQSESGPVTSPVHGAVSGGDGDSPAESIH